VRGAIGERVIVYLDQLGRVEGLVARHTKNGFTHPVKLIDISLSGAALATEVQPPLGATVTIGQTSGTVVRLHGRHRRRILPPDSGGRLQRRHHALALQPSRRCSPRV
jgi:hypothetical protein